MPNPGKEFEQFIRIVKMLRAENGCPWDKEQSPRSLRHYLLEETQELIAAIDTDDPQHVKEELGDVLYLIVLLAQIYNEDECFTIADVIAAISTKMVRRHPHVFSGEKIGSPAELRQQWLEIKAEEKRENSSPKKN